MNKSSFIEVNLDKSKELNREDFKFDGAIEIIKKEEKRKDMMHIATHTLAYLIVGSFIVIIFYNLIKNPSQEWKIPTYFISIVSTIIGFYFGGKLYEKR